MSNSNKINKMKPWQVFYVGRKYLGAGVIAKIFNKDKRTAYLWGADSSCENSCASPLELLHNYFSRLSDIGLAYAARAGIQYLQTAVDDDIDIEAVHELLPTMAEEQLADYPALGALHTAINDGADIGTIKALQREAVEEIERTVAKHIKDNGIEVDNDR